MKSKESNSDRIYRETVEYIEHFLARPEMYVGSNEAHCAEIMWMNLLAFLDIISPCPWEEDSFTGCWAAKRRDIQKANNLPTPLPLSDSYTLKELMVFFKEYFDSEIVYASYKSVVNVPDQPNN